MGIKQPPLWGCALKRTDIFFRHKKLEEKKILHKTVCLEIGSDDRIILTESSIDKLQERIYNKMG